MFACTCYMKQSCTLKDLSENRRKILKIQKEVYLSGLELWPAEYANYMQSSADCNTPGENLKIKIKK
jgi:hypothetical protein